MTRFELAATRPPEVIFHLINNSIWFYLQFFSAVLQAFVLYYFSSIFWCFDKNVVVLL
jgi:F0F1-type ATP synthase membrane subunit a